MANLLFVDTSCPTPYSDLTLRSAPMGGTEATVVRVAQGLATRGHSVTVAQHGRSDNYEGADEVRYSSLDELPKRVDAFILLRSATTLPYFREKYKGSKPLIWAHDFNQNEFIRDYPVLHKTGVKILCVSQTHKSVFSGAFLSRTEPVGVTVGYIYNPVVVPDFEYSATEHKKLVFFSSPHKGLQRTLDVFQMLRQRDPAWRLQIANPGYYNSSNTSLEGVENLGCLPHTSIMQYVMSAVCVFHLNDVFPETFGLVHGEANALGVPCITHHIGASFEVLGPQQVMDVRNSKAVIDRVETIERNPGVIRIKPRAEFRIEQVINRWEEVIGG